MRARPIPFIATTLAVSASLFGCAAAVRPAAQPEPIPFPAERVADTEPAVEAYMRAQAAEHHLPGLALGVVSRAGLVYFVGLGTRDDAGAPVTPDTAYRVGEITQAFTAMAILQLRDAGKLDLDDPVALYVPELASMRYPTSDSGPITIRNLVTHTAGFTVPNRFAFAEPGPVYPHPVSDAELRAAARGAVASGTTGDTFAMALAGLVIARASGESYRGYVEGHILAPLGMTDTVWDWDAVPPDRLAPCRATHGTDEYYRRWCGERSELGAMEPWGGLYSSVADMSRFVAFQLSAWPARDGEDTGPLRRSSVREGIPWHVDHFDRAGHLLYQSSQTTGYAAALAMSPDRGVGVIALGPQSGHLASIALGALRRAVGNELPSGYGPGTAVWWALSALQELLKAGDASTVERAFASSFLETVPTGEVLARFAGLRERLGRCVRRGVHSGVLRASMPTRGDFELDCEKGVARVALQVDPSPPFRIVGLNITPRW